MDDHYHTFRLESSHISTCCLFSNPRELNTCKKIIKHLKKVAKNNKNKIEYAIVFKHSHDEKKCNPDPKYSNLQKYHYHCKMIFQKKLASKLDAFDYHGVHPNILWDIKTVSFFSFLFLATLNQHFFLFLPARP